MKITAAKTSGIHYTPPELARFLAGLLARQLADQKGTLSILDPACGQGALLAAIAQALPSRQRKRLSLVGYETDSAAIAAANAALRSLGVQRLTLIEGDFLQAVAPTATSQADAMETIPPAGFDAVIANPPYVRTQVLGARRAGLLAARFGLTGRVDLYHAFARAMADVLRPGGALGLLTSNRFLTVRSGAALRTMLRTQFALEAIYDLGDTRLFAAAVLPVIVVATKQTPRSRSRCRFARVYHDRSPESAAPVSSGAPGEPDCIAAKTAGPPIPQVKSILAVLGDGRTSGLVRAPTGLFHVERGFLADRAADAVWTLSNRASEAWLKTIARHVATTFGDVGRIRVGIKTTADEVFIRDDWQALPHRQRPEPSLLRPLWRHFEATRWRAATPRQAVLYPHVLAEGRRQAADLTLHPRAGRYLESHRPRLTRRQYVIDSGRKWYEIWVPHHPQEWSLPKIVFPDIAAQGRFFLDRSGAIVNGDCYWITLRAGWQPDWLLWMLAVANSSFIVRYYDVVFHNWLYAGRRRFMTQYVKHFPLPDVASPPAQTAIQLVQRLVDTPASAGDLADWEQQVDESVWRAFGLAAPATGR